MVDHDIYLGMIRFFVVVGVVMLVACGSKGRSMPEVSKRNFERAKQTADRALAACAKLYAAPEGCFRHMPDETWGEKAPVVAIGDLWTGDKSDVDYLLASCTWSRDSFKKMFPNAEIEGTFGSPGCDFRPYPKVPPRLNPGDPPCSTGKPYADWDFLKDNQNSELVQVPYDDKCAGAWEAIEVRRVSPDGYFVDLHVWLKTAKR